MISIQCQLRNLKSVFFLRCSGTYAVREQYVIFSAAMLLQFRNEFDNQEGDRERPG